LFVQTPILQTERRSGRVNGKTSSTRRGRRGPGFDLQKPVGQTAGDFKEEVRNRWRGYQGPCLSPKGVASTESGGGVFRETLEGKDAEEDGAKSKLREGERDVRMKLHRSFRGPPKERTAPTNESGGGKQITTLWGTTTTMESMSWGVGLSLDERLTTLQKSPGGVSDLRGLQGTKTLQTQKKEKAI